MNVSRSIGFSFSKYAKEYDQFAMIQAEIGERLFERLNYLKIDPKYILDLGCGTGRFSRKLQKYYPKATIVSLDLSSAMLTLTRQKQSFHKKWPLVQADMMALPFGRQVFDLVFANQIIHWATSITSLFADINRVMAVNGCLMFSTLGPDTFRELRMSTGYAHVNAFMDMHDIGDALLSECFLDPVVDMEKLTAQYPSVEMLIYALKRYAGKNIHCGRNLGLTGKRSWQDFLDYIASHATDSKKIPLTYEVIYGHAWKGSKTNMGHGMVEHTLPFPTVLKN